MKILVTGSRNWDKPLLLLEALRNFTDFPAADVELIHGGAHGADYYAGAAARKFGWKETEVKADWDLHGKAAGPIRNREMLEMRPDIVLAFWQRNSRGTRACIQSALKLGIPVTVHTLCGVPEFSWVIPDRLLTIVTL